MRTLDGCRRGYVLRLGAAAPAPTVLRCRPASRATRDDWQLSSARYASTPRPCRHAASTPPLAQLASLLLRAHRTVAVISCVGALKNRTHGCRRGREEFPASAGHPRCCRPLSPSRSRARCLRPSFRPRTFHWPRPEVASGLARAAPALLEVCQDLTARGRPGPLGCNRPARRLASSSTSGVADRRVARLASCRLGRTPAWNAPAGMDLGVSWRGRIPIGPALARPRRRRRGG